MNKQDIPKDQDCANCGTDLDWWIKQPRTKVYRILSDEYFCSKKCMKKYSMPYDYWTFK
jgi:hypothetical protein